MKMILASATLALALGYPVQAADVSVKLSDVHLCCQNCVKGVDAALEKMKAVTVSADQEEGTVNLTGPDKATVQKAVDALVAAGFFGKSSNPDIKVNADTGARDRKVQTLQIEGLHLCCAKCVKSVNVVLDSVSGVKTNTAAKNAKTFTVTGDFNEKEVLTALQKAGLTGKVGEMKKAE